MASGHNDEGVEKVVVVVFPGWSRTILFFVWLWSVCRDLCIWLPCKSWYKNCTLASIPKPLKFLRPHYPLLKVMYELARTIAKSTTCWNTDSAPGDSTVLVKQQSIADNGGQGGVNRRQTK